MPPDGLTPRVALATCARLPDGDDDAPALVRALASRGIEARAAVWDDPGEDWDAYALVVLRSTWDYVGRRDRFVAWAASVPRLVNSAAVVGWNTDKHYLRDLADAGIPVVATEYLEPPAPAAGWLPWADDVVVKPAVGAGSLDAARHGPGERVAARAHVERLLAAGRAALVQPYLAAVEQAGETGVVFLGGRYSHAIGKAAMLTAGPPDPDALYRPELITPRDASEAEVALAARTLEAAARAAGVAKGAEAFCYARVDLLPDDSGGSTVVEVELTEPSLFFDRAPDPAGATGRFADVIAGRVRAGPLA